MSTQVNEIRKSLGSFAPAPFSFRAATKARVEKRVAVAKLSSVRNVRAKLVLFGGLVLVSAVCCSAAVSESGLEGYV